MTDHTRTTSTQMFTVRMWTEEGPSGAQLRGSVRNVDSGAHRSFNRLDDLTAFLAEQLDEQPIRGTTDR
ncbi:MAG TPA: hypothetical protein VMQ81_09370 [Acidimicrobiia bacterium]|nr:hypothetical protein [Acidimicrobiia bacterium]